MFSARVPVCHGYRERAFLNPVTRWCGKYLNVERQVGASYKRLHGLKNACTTN